MASFDRGEWKVCCNPAQSVYGIAHVLCIFRLRFNIASRCDASKLLYYPRKHWEDSGHAWTVSPGFNTEIEKHSWHFRLIHSLLKSNFIFILTKPRDYEARQLPYENMLAMLPRHFLFGQDTFFLVWIEWVWTGRNRTLVSAGCLPDSNDCRELFESKFPRMPYFFKRRFCFSVEIPQIKSLQWSP